MDSSEQDKSDEDIDDKSANGGGGDGSVTDDNDAGDFVDVDIQKGNGKKEMIKPPMKENEESTPDSIKIKMPEIKEIQEYSDSSPKIYGNARNHYLPTIKSQAHLPKPDLPTTPKLERSPSLSIAETMPSIGKYISERSNSFSAAIVKRLSSLKEDNDMVVEDDSLNFEVTEFRIPGVKVIVKLKTEAERLSHELRGRISFFTRSNCSDCTAVRRFFREKRLVYVEINIDVFPKRENELINRTGSSETPQIFFNDTWLGGMEALNELKKSGVLEAKVKEFAGERCPEGAPAIPVYGEDEEEDEDDDLVETVRYLRRSLPIQDRWVGLRIVKNCFSGVDLLESMIDHLDCSRKKVSFLC
ncbi:hypothetical protein V6N13_099197 [Hibiscus sabdariffa]|uniref:Glutaredoxin domain-containing protein n=1 Tax=Hibiscus sabdariffa TaxID=183260 RepID=A0ABR2PYZ9_9ROSI